MRYILALLACLFASVASAQNVTCPNKSSSDSSNACANTRFVNNLNISGIPGYKTIPYTIRSLTAYGDSITAGYAASTPANNYVSLLGAFFGVTPTNKGVSGREAVDQAVDIHAFSATDTGSQLITYMIGTNDGVFYGTDIIRLMNWKMIHQEELAWLAMPARSKTTAQGSATGVVPAPTYAGTWSNWGATPQAVTISIASPGVITLANHGLGPNQPVVFTTSGALPMGLTAGTTYYVSAGGVAAITQNTFQVSATPNGTPITTTGSQSGTHMITFTSMSKVSNTQGDTATFSGFGKTLYLAYGIQDGNGGSFIVTIDPHAATISIASPGVVTETAHGRKANDPVRFDTTGALPTGLSADTIYYVVGSSITTDTYQVSATAGGTAINTSGSQSGTHTVGTPFQKTYVIDPLVNSTTTSTQFDAAGIYVNGYGSRSTIQTIQGTTHASALLRIDGLTRTTHTIVAKVVSATGAGNIVWFDWFGQPHGSYFFNGPTVIAVGPPRSGTAFLNTQIQPYNDLIRYNTSAMQRDGLNVGFAGIGGYINPSTDLIGDNTHPNDTGMSHIADAIVAAINTSAAARTRQSGEALSLAEGSSAGMVRTDAAGNAIVAIPGTDYMPGVNPTFTGWQNQSGWFPALADYGLPYQASTRGAGTYSAVAINKEGSYGVFSGYSNGATIGSSFTGAFVRVLTGDQYCVFTGSTGKAFCIDSAQAATFYGGVTFNVSPTAPTPSALDNSTKVATTAYVDGGAWTAFSSLTVTCSSGTPTNITAAGAYRRIGETAFFRVKVTNTTNGTCAGYLIVGGFPFTFAGDATAAVFENANGYMGIFRAQIAGTYGYVFKYDGTYPGGSGDFLAFSTVAEVQ